MAQDNSDKWAAKHSSVIQKYERKFDKIREQDAAAHRGLKDFLREGLGEIGTATRGNIAKDIINSNVNKGHVPDQFRQNNTTGYLRRNEELDDDLIDTEFGRLPTGNEILPWNRNRG